MRFFKYHIARVDSNNGTTVFVDLRSHVDADTIQMMDEETLMKFCKESLDLITKRNTLIISAQIVDNDLIIQYDTR